jgi:predicted nucleotidyltransferase
MIANVLSNANVVRAQVFGSRAKGNYKYNSDIDICLFGAVDNVEANRISEELDELPMPYKFDVVSYNSISAPELREHIDRVGVDFYCNVNNGGGN